MRAALGLLTVLPVGRGRLVHDRWALVAFPLVGLVVGLVWTGVAALTGAGLAPGAAAALVVLADVVVTGGLHLDGVADVADGFAARRAGADPDTAMNDPRVGGLGAATLVAVLLVRVTLVAALVAAPWASGLWLVPVLGRAGMVVALSISPSRPGSLAAGLAATATVPVVAGVAGTTAVLALAAGWVGAPPAAVLVAVVAGGGAALACTVAGLRSLRPGGDLVGAAGITTETIALVALAWKA